MTDWKTRALAATRGSQLGAIIIEAMRQHGVLPADEVPTRPRFLGCASITSDGFVMCSYIDADGRGHSGAFVGSVDDLESNIDGLSRHLDLTDEERSKLRVIIQEWIVTDYRSKSGLFGSKPTPVPKPGAACKGYLIDSTTHDVTAVEFADLAALQALVGGSIEVAFLWPTGDTCFVDEEGLLKNPTRFFSIPERPDQPFAGNGVLVGREVEGDQYPNGYTNLPPKMTLHELRARVGFLRGRP